MVLPELVIECIGSYRNKLQQIEKEVKEKGGNPFSSSAREILKKYKVSRDNFDATLGYGGVIIFSNGGRFDLDKACQNLTPIGGKYNLTVSKRRIPRSIEIYDLEWESKFKCNLEKLLKHKMSQSSERLVWETPVYVKLYRSLVSLVVQPVSLEETQEDTRGRLSKSFEVLQEIEKAYIP